MASGTAKSPQEADQTGLTTEAEDAVAGKVAAKNGRSKKKRNKRAN